MHHLKPTGQAGVVLANGSMSSNQGGEGDIRRKMIEADVVEVMGALPPQLFFTTPIPVCLWFLTRDKTTHGRDRRGEFLFIDARKLGYMKGRVLRDFGIEDFAKVAGTVHRWRNDEEMTAGVFAGEYADQPGFCRCVTLAEVMEPGYVLTTGRYVGVEATEDEEETFAETMQELTGLLAEQMAKGADLDAIIWEKLGPVGYAV